MTGFTFRKRNIIPALFIAGLMIAPCVVIFLNFYAYSHNPVTDREDDRTATIRIPRGADFATVADILEQSGFITNRTMFYALAFVESAPTQIRAGEYEISGSMSPYDILSKLVSGKVKGYRMPIPEGFTVSMIAARLAEWGLVNEGRFLQLAHDRAFLTTLSIPGPSIEGYLFPDTYVLTRAMDEKDIMNFMVRRFRRMVTPEMVAQARQRGFSLNDIITLASIIEKEGGAPEEKPFISAVFHNRLKRGMRLQSDPTVIYGLKDFDGNLTRDDLRKKTPYNTYRIKGLPPGPICSPGLDSINAALNPAPVDSLYFVSKNNGSHHFSSNHDDHVKAVIKYQIKRKR
jgi:UPF0755 protein